MNLKERGHLNTEHCKNRTVTACWTGGALLVLVLVLLFVTAGTCDVAARSKQKPRGGNSKRTEGEGHCRPNPAIHKHEMLKVAQNRPSPFCASWIAFSFFFEMRRFVLLALFIFCGSIRKPQKKGGGNCF